MEGKRAQEERAEEGAGGGSGGEKLGGEGTLSLGRGWGEEPGDSAGRGRAGHFAGRDDSSVQYCTMDYMEE